MIGVKQELKTKGVTVSDADLADYYLKGIDNATIIDNAVSGFTSGKGGPGGAIGDALTNLRAIADANGLNFDTDFAAQKDEWLKALAKGESPNTFYGLIREKAGEGQSSFVQNLLKTGKDLTSIYGTYINLMANTFGIDPSTIKPNDPLLKNVFSDTGGMKSTDFQALLRKDSRYKGTTAAAGAADSRQAIVDKALALGVTLTDAEIDDIFNNSVAVGGGASTIEALVRAKLHYKPGDTLGGSAGSALADLKATAKANGLDFDTQFGSNAQEWVSKILQGESPDTYKNLIRQAAATGLPDKVKELVNSGINLDTIYSPYKNIMAQVLEINPQTIGLDDKTLRSAIGDKEMTLYDWQNSLRKDARWQYTDNARQSVSSSALNVLKDLGFQG